MAAPDTISNSKTSQGRGKHDSEAKFNLINSLLLLNDEVKDDIGMLIAWLLLYIFLLKVFFVKVFLFHIMMT